MPSISQQKVHAVHTLLRLSQQHHNISSSDNLIYQSCYHQQPHPLEVQVSCEDPPNPGEEGEGDLDSMSDEDNDCLI
jgi:hypothetical protein